MAIKPETRFKMRIRPFLDAIPNSYWVKIAQISGVGVPDFFGCVAGQFIAIELKDTGEEPDKIQEWHLEKIVLAEGLSFVMNPENYEKTLALLYELACKKSVPVKKSKPKGYEGEQ